jgi:hypothetical protein
VCLSQNAEVGVFIKVVPVIAALMQNLTEELDARLTAHSAKGTHLCLGDVYVGGYAPLLTTPPHDGS